jgi:Tfp pilus assembly protein PilO
VKPKLILIGVGAALVITAAWFFLLWSPQGKNIDKAKADQAAAEQRASELQARLTHLQRLEDNKAVLEQARAFLATKIPSADELDRFILEVNERASKSGVDFMSISPAQPSAGGAPAGAAAVPGAPTAIGLQMQVVGDYFAILNRDGERLVTVNNFALSKGTDGNKMTASISGQMFLTNAASTPAAAPAASTTPSA